MVIAIQRSTINSSRWQTGNTHIQSLYHRCEEHPVPPVTIFCSCNN